MFLIVFMFAIVWEASAECNNESAEDFGISSVFVPRNEVFIGRV
jgi:hypothetical protein